MRYFIPILFFLTLFSCRNGKTTTENKKKQPDIIYKTKSCPEDGSCHIEVMYNKSLLIKTDHTGKIYPEIIKGKNLIIKYQYQKEAPEGTADGNYTEIIYFELPDKKINLNLHDENLKQVKMLYGRLCFCRGASGYYRINRGNLSVVRTGKKQLKILLNFKMNKIPQVIEHIDEIIELN